MVSTVRLAVIPGDGIGPEVVGEALRALDAAVADSGISFVQTPFSLGAARYLETGDVLTDDDLAAIKDHDAILLGAVGGVPGDPRLAGANIERGLLLRLRFELDHVREPAADGAAPGRPSPLSDPGEVDFVVVREGTEGPYVGNGGAIRVGTPAEVANEVSVNTAYGRRARGALRVRRGIRTPAQAADARAQVQRARLRRVALGSDVRRGRGGVSRRRGGLPARRRRDDRLRHGPG